MPLNLTNHKAIDTYYAALATYQTQGVTHEQATRLAFSTLLDTLSRAAGWTLVLNLEWVEGQGEVVLIVSEDNDDGDSAT